MIFIENWDDIQNNNTLAAACLNWNLIGDIGATMADRWTEVYLQDAVTRLDPLIEGVNLTVTDVSAMQEACAFEVWR